MEKGGILEQNWQRSSFDRAASGTERQVHCFPPKDREVLARRRCAEAREELFSAKIESEVPPNRIK